jgi:hypothetical protein
LLFSGLVSAAGSEAAGGSAPGAAGLCSLAARAVAARFSVLVAFLRAAVDGFGAGAEGFSESRCSMFFKPLRIDFGRFSAMRDPKGLCRAILLQQPASPGCREDEAMKTTKTIALSARPGAPEQFGVDPKKERDSRATFIRRNRIVQEA